MIVTPVFPALLARHDNLSQKKVVWISPIPGAVQEEYVIFEVPLPANTATQWLGIPNYSVKRRALAVRMVRPADGKIFSEKWVSFSTVRPMGRLIWENCCQRLITPGVHLPPTERYYCVVEKFISNPLLEQLDHLLNAHRALRSDQTPEPHAMKVDGVNIATFIRLEPSTFEDDNHIAKVITLELLKDD